MSNDFSTGQSRVLFPVQVTPEAFESILESPISSLTSQADLEPQVIYLEVGVSRVNTGDVICDYLDGKFPGLLDMVFDVETDVIEFSK